MSLSLHCLKWVQSNFGLPEKNIIYLFIFKFFPLNFSITRITLNAKVYVFDVNVIVSRCHRGGRMRNINAWYLNTHMVYL
jgi:hypothetical protein